MRARRNSLQRRCESQLQALHVPDPFDLTAFIDALSTMRGRPIKLYGLPSGVPDVPSGLWVPDDEAGVDNIFAEDRYGSHYQHKVIFHECGHMVFGHQPVNGARDWALLASIFRHIDLAAARGVLCRDLFEDPQEQEAEMFASLISSRIRERVGDARDIVIAAPAEASEAMRKLASALGSR